MSKLTAEQIAGYAHDAGFRGQGLTIAVAVALAESSGNPKAHNATPPDNSYGLWQINMLGSLGPARRREFGLHSNDQLFDPAVNARVANRISKDGKSWTPWSTYTNGAYKKVLDKARHAIRSRPSHGGSKADKDGYQVDPDMMHGFVQRTRRVADQLTSAGTKHVRSVREIADDSFGKVGKESGFAEALDQFGAALFRQVKGVASRADTLAANTAKATQAYRDQEGDAARRLGGRKS